MSKSQILIPSTGNRTRTREGGPGRLRFTSGQYLQMSARGYFRDRRVELLQGEVIELPPQEEPHGVAVNKARRALERIFGDSFYVRSQQLLRLSPRSVVDPDVAVVAGAMETWASRPIPGTALLIVEVSDSTLAYDRKRKSAAYAKAGIEDYWIVNLRSMRLEVRRKPQPDPSTATGFGYATTELLGLTERIAPLAKPRGFVTVSDLMPRAAR